MLIGFNSLALGALWTILVGATSPSQFVFNNGAEPEFLDPHRMSASTDNQIAIQMNEGLLEYDRTAMKLIPALAKSWDSKDNKTFTFTLNLTHRWSNGELITPDQIRASILRSLSPDVASPNSHIYAEIEGAKAYMEGYKSPQKAELEQKVAVMVKGKNQLVIKLIRPISHYAHYFAQRPFFLVHPSMADPSSPAWRQADKFIVNGAYRLKSWEVNRRIVLEKNPHYHSANKVALDEVVALPINDVGVTLNMFRAGDLDWTGVNTLGAAQVPSLRADPQFRLSTAFGTYAYVFNIKRKPFDDARVRKALSLAVHRAEITDKILRAGQIPSSRYVPPGIAGYKPAIKPPPPFDKQIEEAKRLLAEAGYPEGKGFPEVTVLYNTSEGHHKIAQAVQQMWKRYLGIEVRLENKEWKVLLAEQTAKRFDMIRYSWIGEIADPIDLLQVYASDSGNNYSNWGNARYDKLVKEAAETRNTGLRMQKLADAEKILLEELPFIPIYHYAQFCMVNPKLEGFQMNMFGSYSVKYYSKKK